MTKPGPNSTAIVVGDGMASARAALGLAQAGAGVVLLTSEDWLTPGASGLAGIPLLLEVARHPKIELVTGATVEAIQDVANLSPAGSKGQRRWGDEAKPNGTKLHVTISQAPRFVNPERCTACGACAEVCPVLLPGSRGSERGIEIGAAGAAPAVLVRAADGHHRAIHRVGVPTAYAIDKAGTAPCRHACPIDQRAQGYVALIRAGNFQAAYRAIKRENPFPSVCGRVCNHRCEENCTRCQIDEPVAVMALKRFVADWAVEAGVEPVVEVTPRSAYRVAVVGAGPAGLTAARELNRMGHRVVVFEALPVAGGMMRVGIPAFRLPRERLQNEIDEILSEGVELRTNSRVEDVESLLHPVEGDTHNTGFDAAVLAVGLHVSRRLSMTGAEAPLEESPGDSGSGRGLMGAVEFLRSINLGERPDWRDRRVVVVGGGSTAMDTARVCRRLGAVVEVVYRRSRAEMPAHDFEVDGAQREGVTLCFLTNPTRLIREEGRLVAVECVRMELGEPDESGRRRPSPIKGSEFNLPVDTLLLAIGQASDLSLLPDDGSVGQRRGIVQHDPATLMTDRPGLFVAGDVAGTDGFVVDAIANGLQVARSVDRYLRGGEGVAEPVNQPLVQMGDDLVAQRLNGAATEGSPRARTRSMLPETLLGDFEETELGLNEDEAIAEAARCLSCGVCSECLACVDICPADAIDHQRGAQVFELDVDVGIWADETAGNGSWESGFQHPTLFVAGDDAAVDNAVDQALAHLGAPRQMASWVSAAPVKRQFGPLAPAQTPRIGVFLCRCGGEIERVVDLPAVAARAEGIAGVTYSGQVDFACHPEGTRAIREAATAQALDGAVLAACACCALDQLCYSCTTQRARCKEQLGVWDNLVDMPTRFVNVREQCAFVHRHDPVAATLKAGDIVAAAVAGFGLSRRDQQAVSAKVPGLDLRFPITAGVDPVRCRGCEDCEEICGLDAMHVLGTDGARIAQVDATRCLGCGVCIAVCSSGAILAGDTSDAQAEAMLAAMGDLGEKTVVFSCNWGAYSAIEAAAVERLSYDPSVRLVRLMCAGRAHEGVILRAFAQGAARVLVLACGHDGDDEGSSCHYHTGSEQAGRSVAQAQRLLSLLGIDASRLKLAEIQPGDGAGLVAVVQEFAGMASELVPQGRA